MAENVLKLPESDAARSALRTIKAEKSGLADLERALGKKTYELEVLGNGFRACE